MREMELLKAGVDSQGDTFMREALEHVVNEFKDPLPITIGFEPTALPVGSIEALKLDGDTVVATVKLDDNGAKAADGGMELASGGKIDLPKGHEHGTPLIIAGFTLTGAALTDTKVK